MMEVFSRMMKRVEAAGLLRGFRADGRRGEGLCVSHLLFADDTILFCDANEEWILHIRMLLLCFQVVTGLKVNALRSEMVPIGEVPNIQILAEILGCQIGNLGLPDWVLAYDLSWYATRDVSQVPYYLESNFGEN